MRTITYEYKSNNYEFLSFKDANLTEILFNEFYNFKNRYNKKSFKDTTSFKDLILESNYNMKVQKIVLYDKIFGEVVFEIDINYDI